MKEKPTSTDIQNSVVQLLPNAQYAIQNFYGIKATNHEIQGDMCNEERILDGIVANMYYYSDSRPDSVEYEIKRKAILELIENRLDDYNILCLYGDDGVGVTTVLSQFVQKHATHCVSYFYDGLSIMWLNPEVMEHSIVEQLYWFVFGGDEHFNRNDAQNHTLATLWTRVSRKIKNDRTPLYFAFDGFDDLPMEKKESVKHLWPIWIGVEVNSYSPVKKRKSGSSCQLTKIYLLVNMR